MTCKFEISGPHRLTCRAVRKLLQAFTRRHVPCAMCHQSTHDKHHRRSGVLARRMVPRRARSDQPFGRYSRNCLDTHTDRQTRPGQLFFTDPPEEIFVHRTFNAKAFERSFTTILDYCYLFTFLLVYIVLILDCVGYFHRPKKPLIQSRYTHISECFLLARLRRRINEGQPCQVPTGLSSRWSD